MSISRRSLFKALDVLSYAALLLTAAVVPLAMDTRLVNFYIIPKQYVFIVLVLASFLFFAIKAVLFKRLEIKRSFIDIPIAGLLLLGLISSLFSVNIYDSFFGRNEFFVLNFFFLVFLALFYWLLVNFLNTPRRWRLMTDALIAVGGLTALVFVLKMVFKLNALSPWVGEAWNTIDRLNSLFGLWLVVIFILSAGQLIKKNLPTGRAVAYFFVCMLALASLVLLSFNVLWWILLCGLILILLLGVSVIREARLGWLSVVFALLILTAVFIVFGSPRSLQSAVPAEVALGLGPSWAVSSDTLFSGAKNFLFGSGLGSFIADFSRFRPENFNYDSVAWSMRFGQPLCAFLAVLSEGGVLFTLLFAFITLFVAGHVLQTWFKMRSEGSLQDMLSSLGKEGSDIRLDIFLIVICWVVLTIGLFFMFYGPSLWWLWWLFLGMSIVGLSFLNHRLIRQKEWAIEDTPQYSLSFSFVLVVIIAATIMVVVWGSRLYVADLAYARALQSKDLPTAIEQMRGALALRANADTYHAALAQAYLLQAAEQTKAAQPDIQAVSNFVALAINEAKAATDLSPNSVSLWENLATMYENAALLVPDARGWAVKALVSAKDLEPSNPVLWWRLGNNYTLLSNWEEATKAYEQAVNLKADYVGAYIGLANAYEQANKADQAIEAYQRVLPGAMNNAEVLFNFGRLLFNRNKGEDRATAEKLWLEAARLQPNYSNVLYSLGLLYENKGDRAEALRYYYKVKDLNPGNKDVSAKIRAMVE